ncbi:hypothetical protein MUG94_11885 [Arthrobacter gengyunqii]|uniref:Uncharacterized protein n=1 Tax=Arthrobacter gengyunqii TaxID=2886940 RepID=A0A9X1LYY8_9MICC|nr:hypothetical protein [Arthrobacter gengyunqii]MCC3267034.1 hypothetical protein [Arthrobacter gengyunqii]MCC3267815.1 hypothetical protein [Arthrobacter gengyunqii]UOY95242.1 hypothetical protein MUG94_11885 [Arthrobacter gengyunqii]
MGSEDKANHEHKDSEGTTGPEGTIPDTEDGIAAASTDEASNFEPEEDQESAEGSK